MTALSPTEPQARARDAWDPEALKALIDRLLAVRGTMLEDERRAETALSAVDPSYRASARNLTHYLAMRRHDLRALQDDLARLGLSSLGRAESNVLASLDKVLGILHRLAGAAWTDHSDEEPTGLRASRELLLRHTTAVFGEAPAGRAVRIMVTLPSEAASDQGLVRALVTAGMDIARINCAHDHPAEWRAMAAAVRAESQAQGRPVRILMDLGGPKLRTGAMPAGPAVLKVRPTRDEFGRVVDPARLGLRAAGATAPVAGATVHVGVDASWLAQVQVGDRLELVDARGARRVLMVTRREASGAVAELLKTAYLVPTTRLVRHHGNDTSTTTLAGLIASPGAVLVERGDMVLLTHADIASKSDADTVSCTLPEVFDQVRPGERIWFDDGRIGGVIRNARPDGLDIEITHARAGGEFLRGDKGINLPDSHIELPGLQPKDLSDLAVVAEVADLVGLSFAQRSEDVDVLREHLRSLHAATLGIVLKIETRRGFENLPQLLYTLMQGPGGAVMIARGDLAVECGYERLAEVQEEILWAAEAAHVPVIWATQVLETLAKTGRPSRAEVTDAAMAERAECVMLNKGPFIVDAIGALDEILQRMRGHQAKKRPLLRALTAWGLPPSADVET